MATYTKFPLSASVNGRGVLVVAVASTGTTIHTATNTADELDEVWLWAQNHRQVQEDLVVEFGGVVSGDRIEVGIPAQSGPVPILPGLLLTSGLVITAFGTVASGVTLFGYVNRINQA